MNLAAVAGAILILLHGATAAQVYPVKPVRIIVPNAPGGLADMGARIVAAKLAETLGQQFVVDNRPGAGGTLGTAAAVKAPPDGYTLLVVFDSHVTDPHLFRTIEYDTANDLAPVSLLVRGPLVLVVNPRMPVKSTAELLRLARAKPGAINFATVGPGSPSRLLVELLRMETGETVPGFVAESWVALLAPAKTPPEILARLNAEAVRAVNAADVRERFAEQGLETVGSSAAGLDRHIRAEIERWGKLIRARNITLE